MWETVEDVLSDLPSKLQLGQSRISRSRSSDFWSNQRGSIRQRSTSNSTSNLSTTSTEATASVPMSQRTTQIPFSQLPTQILTCQESSFDNSQHSFGSQGASQENSTMYGSEPQKKSTSSHSSPFRMFATGSQESDCTQKTSSDPRRLHHHSPSRRIQIPQNSFDQHVLTERNHLIDEKLRSAKEEMSKLQKDLTRELDKQAFCSDKLKTMMDDLGKRVEFLTHRVESFETGHGTQRQEQDKILTSLRMLQKQFEQMQGREAELRLTLEAISSRDKEIQELLRQAINASEQASEMRSQEEGEKKAETHKKAHEGVRMEVEQREHTKEPAVQKASAAAAVKEPRSESLTPRSPPPPSRPSIASAGRGKRRHALHRSRVVPIPKLCKTNPCKKEPDETADSCLKPICTNSSKRSKPPCVIERRLTRQAMTKKLQELGVQDSPPRSRRPMRCTTPPKPSDSSATRDAGFDAYSSDSDSLNCFEMLVPSDCSDVEFQGQASTQDADMDFMNYDASL
eukprot:g17093.t1